MNTYELTVVLDGKAPSAKKKKVIENIEKLLKLEKGEIKKSDDWGVKDLSYKIGKSTTGLFQYFEIEMEPGTVKNLNEKLRVDADIIRHLIVKK
jgi:small subunit ribosomal protein S6